MFLNSRLNAFCLFCYGLNMGQLQVTFTPSLIHLKGQVCGNHDLIFPQDLFLPLHLYMTVWEWYIIVMGVQLGVMSYLSLKKNTPKTPKSLIQCKDVQDLALAVAVPLPQESGGSSIGQRFGGILKLDGLTLNLMLYVA